MAKKDTVTIDTEKVSSGIQTFNDKKKSYTTAYKRFKSSYLSTCGDSTVRKLRGTVSSLYESISTLYNGINNYSIDYLKSVQDLENALKDGLLSSDKESEIRDSINAINLILNGADPTSIIINPVTGEVSVSGDYPIGHRPQQDNYSPKSMLTDEVKEANRDYLYQFHLAHPKLATFLDGWTFLPFELGAAGYSKKQQKKLDQIKKKNTKAYIAGTAAGILMFAIVPGGGEAEGAKLLLVAAKGGASLSKKQLLKTGAKVLVKQELKDAPINFSFALKDGYNFSTGKVNWDTVKKSMALNVGIDLGLRGLGKFSKGAGKYIKNSKPIKWITDKIDDYHKVFGDISRPIDDVFMSKGERLFRKNNAEMYDFFEKYSANGKEYGVNQGITAKHAATKNQSYKDLQKKLVSQGFSNRDAKMILTQLDKTGACSYADAANLIFYQFRNHEKAFKSVFGYDMFKAEKNGAKRLNSEELLVDLYTWANDTANGGQLISNKKIIDKTKMLNIKPLQTMNTKNQIYMSNSLDGLNNYGLNGFIQSKNKNLGFQTRKIVDTTRTGKKLKDDEFDFIIAHVKECISRNESVGLGIYDNKKHGITMLGEGHDIYSSRFFHGGGHAATVTGVKDNCFVVSSWGKKYYIRFSDLKNGGKFTLDTLKLIKIK